MSERNLFTDGGVVREEKSAGIVETAEGMGVVQPWPWWANWKSDTDDPPGGLNGASLTGAWEHNGKVFAIFTSSAIAQRCLCCFAVSGDPPQNLVPDGSPIPSATLWGGSNWHLGGCLYDPAEEAVYIFCYYTTGITGIVGKWLMEDWPFEQSNAQWISVNSSYGDYETEKICYFINTAVLGGGKLFLSSYLAGNVLTVNAATGVVDGEWVFYATVSAEYYFNLVGYDEENDRPIGGSWHVNAGKGAIKSWNASDPEAWVAVDTVLQDKTNGAATAYEELYGSTHLSLRGAGPYYQCRVVPFYPSQVALLPYLPAGTLLWHEYIYYLGYGAVILEANMSGGVYHTHAPTGAARLAGLSGCRIHSVRPVILPINGCVYLMLLGGGSPQILASNAATKAVCPYFQIVSEETYVAKFTAGTETPKMLVLSLGAAARDREMSTHPGKHAFCYSVDGGTYSDWRSGHELLALDQAVNGKAAWSWSSGDVVRIKHKMTSGLFRHLLPATFTGESGEDCEQLVSLFDAGAPKEVQPVLTYEGDAVVHTIIGIEATAVFQDVISADAEV